jgi:lipopolysaccharide biosynthesis glycosyltransferase
LKDIPNQLNIYIGYDSREDIAYQVCKQSILDRSKNRDSLNIIPIKQDKLRKQGIYTRPEDALASTEFTFTRFLVPYLNNYKEWALFIDCDFVFLEDINKLFAQVDDQYAIMCAQHDYTPTNKTKMDGQVQHMYPRKNWSSMMLINCGHPSNKVMTKRVVNSEHKTGAYFHRFSWLKDTEIGKISHKWNWLVGWYKEPTDGQPKALHYTEGGPWFEEYENCEYAYEWYKAQAKLLRTNAKAARSKRDMTAIVSINDLDLSVERKEVLQKIQNYIIDPDQTAFNTTLEEVQEMLKPPRTRPSRTQVCAIETEFNSGKKGINYDSTLAAFVTGIPEAVMSSWDVQKDTTNPLAIRGLGSSTTQNAIKHCWETGRDFYAMDSAYFGNVKGKLWHRITKNALQNLGPIIDRPYDRMSYFDYDFNPFTNGSKILICPPSGKVMKLFNQLDPEAWTEQVITELKQYTDRPIEVRLKPIRSVRTSTNDTIQNALKDDVHCVVTFNSVVATEALMAGKPAIALGENAAQVLCNNKLSEIENLNYPSQDEIEAFVRHLTYCQFTEKEMQNGYAWNILNESS